ncbi:hypothetical protein GZL_04938 [Streptomyces sp. 769]|nr:hypothetical protein GZL_04938 [Streptomyces sp. 769]
MPRIADAVDEGGRAGGERHPGKVVWCEWHRAAGVTTAGLRPL